MQVYLHIPFCHRICPYCSFYKHTPGGTDIKAFLQALIAEAKHATQSAPSPKLSTLYLGGGTPSMLSPTHLRFLFEELRGIFDFSEIDELTFEANPATFDLKKAQLFRELGVTRISLGIQSFDDAVLKTLGREHSSAEAQEAVPLLRQAGIPQVNIDLMFSIPGQTLESWRSTLETAISLKPDHISAYNLTYEEDTAFIDKLTAGEYHEDVDTNARFFSLAHDLLTDAGFDHYETSNYAKAGSKPTRSTHNSAYWKGANYLGLGPSAVSTVGSTRWKNLPDTANYIKQIQHVGHAKTEIEELSPQDLHLEHIAMALRTAEGLPLKDLTPEERLRAQQVIDGKLATTKNDSLILTSEGQLVTDSVIEHIV